MQQTTKNLGRFVFFFSVFYVFLLFSGLGCAFAGSVVTFDDDGTAVVNGKRTILYGTYRDVSDRWQTFSGVKEAGFNLTHDYHFENRAYKDGADDWITDARKYLALAERAEVGTFMGVPRELAWRGDVDEVANLVNGIKDMPALWFWYIMDEPSLQGKKAIKDGLIEDHTQGSANLHRIYETIKRLDPHHPVILVDAHKRLQDIPEYASCCDTIWSDVYVHRYSILEIYRDIQYLQELAPGKPNIGIAHGASNLPFSFAPAKVKQGIEFPDKLYITDRTNENPPEVLWGNVHASLAAGAQGVVFYWLPKYMHDVKKQTPANWQAMCDIGKMFGDMNDILVAKNRDAGVTMEVDQWGHLLRQEYLTGARPSQETQDKHQTVAMWQREYQGDIYVGLVCDFVPVQRVTLKLPHAFKTVSLMPSGKTVVKFDPDGKHFCEFDALPVALWKLADREMSFLMQDADSVMLKFSK